MRISLRTVALTVPVLLGVFLGFEVKPAQAQYYSGSPYGSYYGQAGPYNYGMVAPGFNSYSPGYYSGGMRSWAPGAMGGYGFGFRRSWAPRISPRQRYMLIPPSI